MQSMDTFNPETSCLVHDQLNEQTIEWKSEWADDHRQYAAPYDRPGVIS